VLASLKAAMGVEVGETTSDRMFSLDVGRCFGACGLAPVIMIDEDVHQQVKPAKLAKILDGYREDTQSGGNGVRAASGDGARAVSGHATGGHGGHGGHA
jgi:hypothetical protein